jgi:hypothetical protein
LFPRILAVPWMWRPPTSHRCKTRKAEQAETVPNTAPRPETVDGSIVETALTAETTEEAEIALIEESQPERAEPEDVSPSVRDAFISKERKEQ